MLLAGRVAIVTGGALGMGRAIAKVFAEQGCDVVIADINLKEAENTLAAVRGAGRDGLALKCDVSNSAEVKAVVTEALNRFGKVDILVNNAGRGPGAVPMDKRGIADISEELWDRLIAINLKGAFLFCREVVPGMKERRYGKIVNLSSIGVLSPPVPTAHYHAAKAGIVGMTMDMAVELAPYNINVNAIMPGPVRTDFYAETIKNKSPEEIEAFFAQLGKSTPLQRVGLPEDIAYAALFLASDWASFITGVTIPVAGGLPLQPQRGVLVEARK